MSDTLCLCWNGRLEPLLEASHRIITGLCSFPSISISLSTFVYEANNESDDEIIPNTLNNYIRIHNFFNTFYLKREY